MPLEPLRRQNPRALASNPRNPYEGRWNYWYSAIADLMIDEPGIKIGDIALRLGKHANTISMIVNTDMFKEFFAQRRDAYTHAHDFALTSKMTRVAELAMDSVIAHIEKKKDQLPLNVGISAMNSALDRLGYGPKAEPAVSVQVNNTQNVDARKQTVVVEGVSATALEEARAALRLAESRRAEVYDGGLAGHESHRLAPRVGTSGNLSASSDADSLLAEATLDLFAVDVGTLSPSNINRAGGDPPDSARQPQNPGESNNVTPRSDE